MFLDMDKTSLNAKHGMKNLSSFQSFLAHDLAYWDLFFLAGCPNETNILNWDSLHPRLNSHCKARSYKKKKHKKIKGYRKSL